MDTGVKTIYLDSCDYSNLATNDGSESCEKLKSMLRIGIDSGDILIVFSCVHVAEFAPLEAKHSVHSEGRIDLLVSLCGKNTLISFDSIIRAEIMALCSGSAEGFEFLNFDGEWYPNLDSIISPVDVADILREEYEKECRSRKLNRHLRRAFKKHLFKKKLPRKSLFSGSEGSGLDSFDDLLEIYPMRKKDAKVISDFVVGKATKESAENAFLECLRDPSWMMRWFEFNSHKMSPFTEWLRRPAADMKIRFASLIEMVEQEAFAENRSGGPHSNRSITMDRWRKIEESTILSIVRKLAEVLFPESSQRPISIADVRKVCPGLYTSLSLYFSVAWAGVGERSREMKDSDFLDCLHAIYAPYVDVFRADKFMAPRLEKLLPNSTYVARNLDDLVANI